MLRPKDRTGWESNWLSGVSCTNRPPGVSTRDLRQRLPGTGDVIAGTEIDDQIERGVGKRHASHVAGHQLGGDTGLGQTRFRFLEEAGLGVEPDQPGRPEHPTQDRQRHPAATTDLEHAGVSRQAEGADHERDFEGGLAGVPALFIGKGPVLQVCRRLPGTGENLGEGHHGLR